MNLKFVANESIVTKVIMFQVIAGLCRVVSSVGLGVFNRHGTIIRES